MSNLSPTIDGRTTTIGFANLNTAEGLEYATEYPSITVVTAEETMSHLCANSFNSAYQINRYHVEFDTSNIAVAPKSATLKLYGSSTSNVATDFYLVKTTFATAGAIVVGEHIEWLNDGDDNYDISNKVAYSSKFDVSEKWYVDGYNEISLNSTALADMASNNVIQITMVSHFEYDQTTLGDGENEQRFHTNDNPIVNKRPILSYMAGLTSVNLRGGFKLIGGKITIK